MIRAARIIDNIVADIWIVPALDAFPGETLVEAPPAVQIGDAYVGGEFYPPPPPPPEVPEAITARQLRRWLALHEIDASTIDAMIDAMSEPERTAARIDWEYATVFERHNQMLIALASAALGLTGESLDAALDAAFIEAAHL